MELLQQLHWFPTLVAFFGAALMWAAQIHPEQAVSNISEWFRALGVEPPNCLKKQRVDKLAKWLGASLLIGGITFAAFPVIVTLEPSKVQHSINKKREDSARRWITLSGEILADIQTVKPTPPSFSDNSLPPEIRDKLWQKDTERMLRAFDDGLAKMNQRYLARSMQAQQEMVDLGILKKSEVERPFVLVNAYSWSEWAGKLGAGGRKILDEYHE